MRVQTAKIERVILAAGVLTALWVLHLTALAALTPGTAGLPR